MCVNGPFVLPDRLAGGRVVLAILALAAFAGGCHRRRFAARGDAAAVVVVSPHAQTAPDPTLSEREPNDKPEQAQFLALNPDWPVLTVESELAAASPGGGSDVDVFRLVVPARDGVHPDRVDSAGADDGRADARRLSVELSPSGGVPLLLQLLDDQSKAIESLTVDANDKAGMPNMAVVPAHTYFLRVKFAAKPAKGAVETGSSRYRLSVQLSDFALAEEREPNDTLATAHPLEMKGAADVSGFIGWTHDQDLYRLPSPDVVSALDLDLEAVDGVALGVQVLDGAGSRIAGGRARKSEAFALRNVTIPASAGDASPGTNSFHVMVRGETGHNRNAHYVLHLSMGSVRQDAEIEPNDSVATATAIHDGTFTGFLPIGDVDHFRYGEGGGRELSLEVACPTRIRCTLEVTRVRDGQVLARAEAKKTKQTVAVANVPTQGEPVVVRVGQGKGDGNAHDPYQLKVTSVSAAIPQIGPRNSTSP